MRAIIVVDCQNDFSDHGTLAVVGAGSLATKISNFLKSIDLNQYKVVFTKDWHPKEHISFQRWPRHCVANTVGSEYIHPLELFQPKALEIKKGTICGVDSYSAFYENKNESKLLEFLKANKIQAVYVCGLVKDICVLETVNDSVKFGYNTYILEDLSLALDENVYESNVSEKVTSIKSDQLVI